MDRRNICRVYKGKATRSILCGVGLLGLLLGLGMLNSCGGGGGGGATSIQMGGSIQGKNLNLAGNVTTLAGIVGTSGSDDGTGTPASFDFPFGVTTDGTNLYVTDTFNSTIRKIVISTGVVSTLAGTAGNFGFADGTGAAASFNFPTGITTDGIGNLYVADTFNNTIRKIVISTGVVSTLAGNALNPPGSANGAGLTAASFNFPSGITTDGTNLYVADTDNNTIRKIVISTGVVSTLAGDAANPPGSADGTGAAASFDFSDGTSADITTDGVGNLYVADTGNNTIRKIVIGTGVVSTLAGQAGVSGSADAPSGPGTAATFDFIDGGSAGITTDGTNLYVADTGNSTIRKIVIAGGAVTTLAGAAGNVGSDDGPGLTTATFNFPIGITTDGTNLYVADTANSTIRKIVIASGVVSTLAGNAANPPGSADGSGTPASFDFSNGLSADITTDVTNLYVADTGNNTIRKIVIGTGVVTTLGGTAGNVGSDDGTGPSASFDFSDGTAAGITTDGTNLYVADTGNSTIRQIVISSGVVTTLAGTAGSFGSDDGPGLTTATFNFPTGITTDGTNLYVADTFNNTIRKIVIASGVVSTLAGQTGVSGHGDGPGLTAASFDFSAGASVGITTDGTNLYVADTGNNTIRKIVIGTGVVSTLAGTGSTGFADGTGVAASFDFSDGFSDGITTDGTNLYVADTGNSTIRQIVISSGVVTTPAGSAGIFGSDDGAGDAASFNFPTGITTDGTSLYVVDTDNNTIRKIQ